MSTVLFRSARQVVTCERADASAVHENVDVLVRDGRIAAVGAELQTEGAPTIDASRYVITPGFIDSHTHAVFGGWRAAEYEMRSQGIGYMEIARRGGGINASIRDVRAMSEAELLERSRPRLAEMLALGTTTVEIKSGYGLTVEDELKQLRVIRALQQESVLDIVPTFLGAHEFPPEYRDNRHGYVDLIIEKMIPAVAAERLAVFCDVFLEPGVFTVAQARRILEAAREHGMKLKLHADEFENGGAAELAGDLHATSADHLGAISDAGVAALARSGTVATLLPATLLFLGKQQYAPARPMIERGVCVALATDFNPGTAPTPSMPLILTLASSLMGMTPLEALCAATAGGARALDMPEGTGTLAPGAPADLLLWNAADYREIAYRFGALAPDAVFKAGRAVDGQLVRA